MDLVESLVVDIMCRCITRRIEIRAHIQFVWWNIPCCSVYKHLYIQFNGSCIMNCIDVIEKGFFNVASTAHHLFITVLLKDNQMHIQIHHPYDWASFHAFALKCFHVVRIKYERKGLDEKTMNEWVKIQRMCYMATSKIECFVWTGAVQITNVRIALVFGIIETLK